MKEERIVPTPYGEGKVHVIVCDPCGKIISLADNYYPPEEWRTLQYTIPSISGHSKTRKEEHYCSVECLVRTLVPDIFEKETEFTRQVIQKLRAIEEELA